jgi:acetylornithine deacetylase/succinyl-diaminopimelate desuccinylase-like protein
VDGQTAEEAIRKVLTVDPPYGAQITVEFDQAGTGWDAPALAPWLEQSTREASLAFYGKDAVYLGLGGSIPFMGMLGEQFPEAQFLITGVLGPKSNAHGPNEFLHISYAKKLTAAVAHIVGKLAE